MSMTCRVQYPVRECDHENIERITYESWRFSKPPRAVKIRERCRDCGELIQDTQEDQ